VWPNAKGYNWTTLFLGEINTGAWPSVLASLKNRDNKISSRVPWEPDLRKAALAMSRKSWKLQTRILVRGGAPHKQICNCLKIIKGKKLVVGPRWVLDTKTEWPTDRQSWYNFDFASDFEMCTLAH
jgi:hypothetical protein